MLFLFLTGPTGFFWGFKQPAIWQSLSRLEVSLRFLKKYSIPQVFLCILGLKLEAPSSLGLSCTLRTPMLFPRLILVLFLGIRDWNEGSRPSTSPPLVCPCTASSGWESSTGRWSLCGASSVSCPEATCSTSQSALCGPGH